MRKLSTEELKDIYGGTQLFINIGPPNSVVGLVKIIETGKPEPMQAALVNQDNGADVNIAFIA